MKFDRHLGSKGYLSACQISKRCDNLNNQSRGFNTSRDLTIRRLIGYWNVAQVSAKRHLQSKYENPERGWQNVKLLDGLKLHQRHSLSIYVYCKVRCTLGFGTIAPPVTRLLTHWGRDKMVAVSQTTLYTFKRIFLNENVRISIKISLKFVPKGTINNNPAPVQIMNWRRSGDKPLFEPMMVRLPTHICVTQPQWVKALKH